MSSGLVVVLAALVLVAVFGWWLMVLVEALRVSHSRWKAAGESRLIYVLPMIFLGIIGSILFVAVARPRLRAARVPASGV